MKKSFAFGCLLFAGAALSFGAIIESRWGACSHPVREGVDYKFHAPMFDGYKDCGIKNIRTDMDWRPINPAEDVYDFTRFDEVIGAAKARGLDWLGIFTGMWSNKINAVSDTERWTKFLAATTAKYKGIVEDWEIINEVDWGSWLEMYGKDQVKLAEAYSKLLKAAYPAIKKANPAARILYSGVAHMNGDFVEETFKHDINGSFDVMNVHIYCGGNPPEYVVDAALKKLHTVLDKYNVKKPIWMTEIGCNTAPLQEGVINGIRAAMQKLQIDPSDAVIIEDEELNYSTNYRSDYLSYVYPEVKKFKKIKLDNIERLDPKTTKAIFLTAYGLFPRDYLNALLEYVANGGTIICPGEIPLAFDTFFDKDGKYSRKSYGNGPAELFHIETSTSWSRTGGKVNEDDIPKHFTGNYEAAEGFEGLKISGRYVSYIPTDAQLKGNDKFIPIFYAKVGDKKYPVGAIYKFDSNLKGNAIVFPSPLNGEGSEDYQGRLLPRYMLVCLANGVDKVFNYSYHSNGCDPDAEGHFGITRYDLYKKPAWYSYKTLIEMCGEKGKPELKVNGEVCVASWTRDDGEKVHAIWSLYEYKKTKVKIKCEGEIKEMRNHLGKKLPVPQKNEFERKLSPGLIYIVGPSSINL